MGKLKKQKLVVRCIFNDDFHHSQKQTFVKEIIEKSFKIFLQKELNR